MRAEERCVATDPFSLTETPSREAATAPQATERRSRHRAEGHRTTEEMILRKSGPGMILPAPFGPTFHSSVACGLGEAALVRTHIHEINR